MPSLQLRRRRLDARKVRAMSPSTYTRGVDSCNCANVPTAQSGRVVASRYAQSTTRSSASRPQSRSAAAPATSTARQQVRTSSRSSRPSTGGPGGRASTASARPRTTHRVATTQRSGHRATRGRVVPGRARVAATAVGAAGKRRERLAPGRVAVSVERHVHPAAPAPRRTLHATPQGTPTQATSADGGAARRGPTSSSRGVAPHPRPAQQLPCPPAATTATTQPGAADFGVLPPAPPQPARSVRGGGGASTANGGGGSVGRSAGGGSGAGARSRAGPGSSSAGAGAGSHTEDSGGGTRVRAGSAIRRPTTGSSKTDASVSKEDMGAVSSYGSLCRLPVAELASIHLASDALLATWQLANANQVAAYAHQQKEAEVCLLALMCGIGTQTPRVLTWCVVRGCCTLDGRHNCTVFGWPHGAFGSRRLQTAAT